MKGCADPTKMPVLEGILDGCLVFFSFQTKAVSLIIPGLTAEQKHPVNVGTGRGLRELLEQIPLFLLNFLFKKISKERETNSTQISCNFYRVQSPLVNVLPPFIDKESLFFKRCVSSSKTQSIELNLFMTV